MKIKTKRLLLLFTIFTLLIISSSIVKAEETIKVSNAKEFVNIINANPSANITLTKDINFLEYNITENALFTRNFSGVINGEGFAIKNLTKPLFHTLKNASLYDLVFDRIFVNDNNCNGIIANYIEGTRIQNVHIINSHIYSGKADGVASIAGRVTNSTISSVSVTDTTVKGWNFTGGLMGRNYGITTVENVFLNVEVKTDGYSVGGFIGRNEGTLNVNNSIVVPTFNPSGGDGGKSGFQGNSNGANSLNFNNTFIGVKNTNGNGYVKYINHILFSGNASGTAYEWSSTPFEKQNSWRGYNWLHLITNENINDSFFNDTLNLNSTIWDINDTSIDKLPTLKGYNIVNEYIKRIPVKPAHLKTVEEYDRLIKNHADLTMTKELEMLLMQRNFVKNIGYNQLVQYYILSEETAEFINWLMEDYENLSLYTIGGSPDGSYLAELQVLNELYQAVSSDFDDKTVSEFGMVKGDLYKKMVFSIAKGYSRNIRFWTAISSNAVGNINSRSHPSSSDPVERYHIYKSLYHNNKLGYQQPNERFVYSNKMFEKMQVEEMRYVLNAHLDDASVKWFNWYMESDLAAKNEPKYNNNPESRRNPYTYMNYRYMDYYQDKYYNANTYDAWNAKYGFSQFGINQLYKESPKLWVIFEEGGICWPISKVGANIWSVLGVPANAVSQPGHLAYVYSSYKAETDEMYWGGIYNAISNWGNTGEGGPTAYADKFHVRMPLQWGDDSSVTGYNASYLALSQENLNNFDSYKNSQMILLLVNTYSGDNAILEQIYRKALEANPRDYKAWLGLTKMYVNDSSKTNDDLYNLLEEIAEKLKYAPLPMYDLFRITLPRINESSSHLMKYNMLLENSLKRDSRVKWNEILESQAVSQTAKHLLGQVDTTVATFSFDGANPNTIVLSESKFGGNHIVWDYSIDGGVTWKQVEDKKITLSAEEIEKISVEKDLLIHIVGVDYSAENIFNIDIKAGNAPTNLYANDLENRVIGAWQPLDYYDEITNTWLKYNGNKHRIIGNNTLTIRASATGTTKASTAVKYNFTEDNQPETRKYINVMHISSLASSPPYNNDKKPTNMIDGNPKTNYYSTVAGDKFLEYKFDTPVKLSAIEYLPYGGNIGRIKNMTIYGKQEGEEYKVIKEIVNWSNTNALQYISFETPVKITYIKFVVTTSYNNSGVTGNMFNFFKDITKENLLLVAKSIIEKGSYSVEQSVANTEELLKIEIAKQINALEGMNETEVVISENDISISSFTAAIAETSAVGDGVNGRADFSVSISKNDVLEVITTGNSVTAGNSVTTENKVATITYTPFIGETDAQLVDRAILQLVDGTIKISPTATTEEKNIAIQKYIVSLLGGMEVISEFKHLKNDTYEVLIKKGATTKTKEIYIIFEKVYSIKSGDNQKIQVNSEIEITFTVDGDIALFEGLYLNGIEIDEDNYTVKSGSVIITLKANYVKELPIGNKEYYVKFKDGECVVNLEVFQKETPTPVPTPTDEVLNPNFSVLSNMDIHGR